MVVIKYNIIITLLNLIEDLSKEDRYVCVRKTNVIKSYEISCLNSVGTMPWSNHWTRNHAGSWALGLWVSGRGVRLATF